MNELRYAHDLYVPKSFVVGMSSKASSSGFPTMKDCKGKWTNLGVFENICGFKPYTQRSELKEIDKAMHQAVIEAENIPTGGFKLINVHENAYSKLTVLFDTLQCATLHDPRGWNVTVSQKNLQKILEAAHFNIDNGEILDVKLMYAWPTKFYKTPPFELVVADDAALAMQADTEALSMCHARIEYIKPKMYEIGKVYSSSTSKAAGHKFMYMGVHDTYSSELHYDAIKNKRYDIQSKLDDKYDMTMRDMHVFYCIDFNQMDINTWRMPNSISVGHTPYFITSSLSKLFECVEGLSSLSFMYNSDKPVTFENVKEDMSESLMFNLLDLQSAQLASFEWQVFKDICGGLHKCRGLEYDAVRCKTYPFNASCNVAMSCLPCEYECKGWPPSFSAFRRKQSFTSFKIGLNYYGNEYDVAPASNVFVNSPYITANFTLDNQIDVLRHLYDKLKPSIMQWKLINGKNVNAYQNAMLNVINE